MTKNKLAGVLLRIERLRQNKGQKEVCYGICVPSYLSKIEHGTVNPDEEIVKQLFSKGDTTLKVVKRGDSSLIIVSNGECR